MHKQKQNMMQSYGTPAGIASSAMKNNQQVLFLAYVAEL
jgi:hypothetical protein